MRPAISGHQTGSEFPLNTNNRNNNNRRRGRGSNRGPGGNSGGGGNQGNRIDSRARGNAPQMLEKYRKLAHDASLNGDRVQTEYYLQFADHYFRVLADSRAMKEEQQQRGRQGDREQQGEDFFDEEDDFDARNRPYETRRERARQEERANAAAEADDAPRGNEGEDAADAAGEQETGDNPFLREERPRRARSRDGNRDGGREGGRTRDQHRERTPRQDDAPAREGGLDAGILPPSIVRDEAPAQADDAPAPVKRAPRARKPRKADDTGGSETLEAVG